MTRWQTSLSPAELDRLVALARRRRPEIDATPPVRIGEGISTLAYGLSSADGEWVLRISRRHPEPWTWRGGRGHEIGLLAELRSRDVPVPSGAMVLQQVDGLPSAILERRILGTQLSPAMVRSEPTLMEQIAAMLDCLHAVDLDDVVVRDVPRDDPVAEFDQALTVVDLADDDLRHRVEAAVAVLQDRRAIRALCHRDFRCEHLIVRDEREIVGLLDLGEVGIDDPAVDLAFLYGELGAEAVAEICASMETSDPGLAAAARTFHSLWPLLELAPGGQSWGDPATAHRRLAALL